MLRALSGGHLHGDPDQGQDHGGRVGGELLHDGAVLRAQLPDPGGGVRGPAPRHQGRHGRAHQQRLPGPYSHHNRLVLTLSNYLLDF